MGWIQPGTTLGRVLVDFNTQWDFLDPSGVLTVRNREAVVPRMRQLTALARVAAIPVISSVEAHRITDTFCGQSPYCIVGTTGQRKLAFTLLSPRIVVQADNSFDLPYNVMSRYRQVIFTKQSSDFFANPKADRLLTELDPQEYVLFGVGLERWIKALALGLLARHKKVAVVADGCGYWSEADADLALRQLAAKSVRILTVDELTQVAAIPRRRVDRRTRLLARHHPATRRPRRLTGARAQSVTR
jgi:nicotinamidase-related amidase